MLLRLVAAPMKLLLQGPPALRRQRLIPSARQPQVERNMTKTAPWRNETAAPQSWAGFLGGLTARQHFPRRPGDVHSRKSVRLKSEKNGFIMQPEPAPSNPRTSR